jgi:hypothetical protein
MTIEDELHQLLNELDEDAAAELLEYAQWLAAEEDQPLDDDERARVEAPARRRRRLRFDPEHAREGHAVREASRGRGPDRFTPKAVT